MYNFSIHVYVDMFFVVLISHLPYLTSLSALFCQKNIEQNPGWDRVVCLSIPQNDDV